MKVIAKGFRTCAKNITTPLTINAQLFEDGELFIQEQLVGWI